MDQNKNLVALAKARDVLARAEEVLAEGDALIEKFVKIITELTNPLLADMGVVRAAIYQTEQKINEGRQ
jgi:hypothetical protein